MKQHSRCGDDLRMDKKMLLVLVCALICFRRFVQVAMTIPEIFQAPEALITCHILGFRYAGDSVPCEVLPRIHYIWL